MSKLRDVISNLPLFVSREEGVKRGSLCNERRCFAPTSVTGESSRYFGGWSACVALTRMSRRLLQRRYDMRGGEGNAALHRCEERRMFRLLKII